MKHFKYFILLFFLFHIASFELFAMTVKTDLHKNCPKDHKILIKEGTFSTITLIKLKRVPAKGIIIQKRGGTPEKYSCVEVSRKFIDLRRHRSFSLDPGFYRFEYNDVRGNPLIGFYDKSDVFEMKSGENEAVVVWVISVI